MADSSASPVRTDSRGGALVHEARSRDGSWHVAVFGPTERCKFNYAYATSIEHGSWSFGVGRDPVGKEHIEVRWDLPNASWGIFIDAECWAIYTHQVGLRLGKHRMHSRSGPHVRPFSDDEIRFLCAKRRGQRKGTKGHVAEE